MARIWSEEDLVGYKMFCSCGAVISEDAPRYPVKAQNVKKIIKEEEVITRETHIVKCTNVKVHPKATEWNYVVHALLRGKN